MLHEKLTEKSLGCGFRVANKLGCGFLEKVYENALVHDLRKAGLFVEQQVRIPVYYDGVLVGDYVAEIVVERSVVLEIKAIAGFEKIHTAQCINYLKATGMKVCLLMNFGATRFEFKRIVLEEGEAGEVRS